MGEIPADWLEKSAAEAAKRMKPDPQYGSGSSNLQKMPIIKSQWIDFQARGRDFDWPVGTYLAVMHGKFIRAVRHVEKEKAVDRYTWFYMNNVIIDPFSSGTDRFTWVCHWEVNLEGVWTK